MPMVNLKIERGVQIDAQIKASYVVAFSPREDTKKKKKIVTEEQGITHTWQITRGIFYSGDEEKGITGSFANSSLGYFLHVGSFHMG